MAWTLPPPPNSDDLTSPVWRDWFYRIGRNVEVVNPEGTQPIQAGFIFGRRETTPSPSLLGGDSQIIQGCRTFTPPQESIRGAVTSIDSTALLATQIFGG